MMYMICIIAIPCNKSAVKLSFHKLLQLEFTVVNYFNIDINIIG